jgi:hypothetical protein
MTPARFRAILAVIFAAVAYTIIISAAGLGLWVGLAVNFAVSVLVVFGITGIVGRPRRRDTDGAS